MKNFPERIISTVPSQTELLYDLGLNERVIGITKFCVHPFAWLSEKAIIGGTKNLNMEKIKSLNPDLIIANKEENTKSQVEALKSMFPVHVTEVKNLDDAFKMILEVGELTGKPGESEIITDKVKTQFQELKKISTNNKKVLYLVWKNPYMSVGNDTFIHDMLERCGFENIFDNRKRYPEISVDEIKENTPGFIFLSSEPYPFKEKHITELQDIYPHAHVILVDGEYFSWYGSRLQKAPAYFKGLIQMLNPC